jgi:hypothetical protein
MRTLEKVRTEMNLHVLAYNLKRVIAILGPQPPHGGDVSLRLNRAASSIRRAARSQQSGQFDQPRCRRAKEGVLTPSRPKAAMTAQQKVPLISSAQMRYAGK